MAVIDTVAPVRVALSTSDTVSARVDRRRRLVLGVAQRPAIGVQHRCIVDRGDRDGGGDDIARRGWWPPPSLTWKLTVRVGADGLSLRLE